MQTLKTSSASPLNSPLFLLCVLALGGAVFWYASTPRPSVTKPIAEAQYLCAEEKAISARFFAGPPSVAQPNLPPSPSDTVQLELSDGRSLRLQQTISGSGIRFANPDESFVFWNKGNTAFVEEHGGARTFTDCITIAPNPGTLLHAYRDPESRFTLRYPENYRLETDTHSGEWGPEGQVPGIRILIPPYLSVGTNLSSNDSGIYFEFTTSTPTCTADAFLSYAPHVISRVDNNIEYSFASSTDAGAGNLYEEMVWTIPGTDPCVAIRYRIHSTQIGNYPPGTVSPFDHDYLIQQLDLIRSSLILAR